MTRWEIVPFQQPDKALIDVAGGSLLVAMLLQQKGITTPAQAAAYLNPASYALAVPEELPGVLQAAELLRETQRAGGRVRVFGDLDTDGQTSTAILYSALNQLGYVCDYELLSHGQGRGLPVSVVEKAAADGVALLMTCDTGTTDLEAVSRARELGLCIIVTDHHDILDALPDADAFVSPKLLDANHPLVGLSGAGVAWELAAYLLSITGRDQEALSLLDIAAIGLIADMAPLQNDVRCLVQRGIEVLRFGERVGLAAIYKTANVDVSLLNEEAAGYHLAPRFNALGRLGEPQLGVELLLTDDDERAATIVGRMDSLNQERRAHIEAATNRAMALIESDPSATSRPVLVVQDREWPTGVLGAVARRLVGLYDRPVIVVADAGDRFVASGRSVEGVDLHEAIFSQVDLLERQGGHPQAAGFTVSAANWMRVREGIQHALEAEMAQRTEPVLSINLELGWADANLEAARALDMLRPFGSGNAKPVFALGGAHFLRAEDVSWNHETAHRRLYVAGPEGERLQLTWFNAGVLPDTDQTVDVALELSRGFYRGEERLEASLVEWRPVEQMAAVSSLLHTGPEVIDLRRLSREQALDALDSLGIQGVVWEERLHSRIDGARTRSEINSGESALLGRDLVIAFVPPDPATARHVLDVVSPTRIVLLPDTNESPLDADRLVELVLQMVRSALNKHEPLDLSRMAARVGTLEGAILAALRLLQARGLIELIRLDEQRFSVQRGGAVERLAMLDRARENVLLQLKEIAAFRRIWERDEPAALLSALGSVEVGSVPQ